MTTQNEILEKNIGELFGFEEMSDDEKAEFLETVGATLMESAALRFVTESEEKVVADFEAFIQEAGDRDTFIEELIQKFPTFAAILDEEIVAFKNEATAVLAT